MSRWNIRSIMLYSHDGRRRDIGLEPGKVNIITGSSHTGKSAIVEIIDYCMGAGECHLPPTIRDRTSWVAMLWEMDDQRFAVARQVPDQNKTTVNEMYWRRGAQDGQPLLPLTSADLNAIDSRDAILRQMEQVFGIGEVKSETFNPDRPSKRISARHVAPYMLQDDDVIISKNTLLRGGNDERRQSIIDTLPYFLRVTDETTTAMESEYHRLQKKLRSEERRRTESEQLVAKDQDRALMLLSEASQLGLIDMPDANLGLDRVVALLERLRQWTPAVPSGGLDNPLTKLYADEASLRSKITELRSQIRSAEGLLNAAVDYGSVVKDQTRKLAHIDVFRGQDDKTVCPVCNNSVAEWVPSISTLRAAYRALSDELSKIGQDRPKLDTFLNSKKEELDDQLERLNGIRQRIAERVRELDSTPQDLDLDHRRSRVAGRISLYLDSRQEISQKKTSSIDEIQRRLIELEEMIDMASKRDRLEIEQQTIAGIAKKVIEHLPFEALEDDDFTVFFLARTLACGISTADRRVPMRDVGSDENYLSLHVALLVAFHRFFKKRSSPVPGVLLFDQLSRPYYPPEDRPEEVIVEKDTEATSLKQYFDFLFQEVTLQEDLQLIILEHAYFRSDPRFVAATKYRWSEREKLIPFDWPKK